jgi:NAD(P)-dependent dehydrogenase (short-subunit alcohol dehydrogenase family)
VGVAAYQASKGALTTLTKNAALTYAPAIRANSIHPGVIRTVISEAQDPEMNQKHLTHRGNVLQELGNAIYVSKGE